MGRSLLPPEAIRWLATSGIMATSEPVRDRITALTRSMSAAKKPIRRAMDGGEGFSNGTTTAKGSLQEGRTHHNRNAMVGEQAPPGSLCTPGLHATHVMWRFE